jgi:hypothetical protein
MTRTDTPRLRPDGSIDTAYYMALGRHRRSEAAHAMAGAAVLHPPRSRPKAGA